MMVPLGKSDDRTSASEADRQAVLLQPQLRRTLRLASQRRYHCNPRALAHPDANRCVDGG